MTIRNCEASSADSVCSLRLGSMLVVSTLFARTSFCRSSSPMASIYDRFFAHCVEVVGFLGEFFDGGPCHFVSALPAP